jgi:inorganic pyrophosphatase
MPKMPKPIPLNVADASPERDKNRFTVVIETPKGSANKFSWDEKRRGFILGKPLPAGSVFPYDFGFIPSTREADGDPVDVVVLLEAPTFPGCLVRVRLIGVIDAEQSTKQREMVRNPRLIGVSTKSVRYAGVKSMSDLPTELADGIEDFFISYNQAAGKTFRVVGRHGKRKAVELVRDGEAMFRRSQRSQKPAPARKRAG